MQFLAAALSLILIVIAVVQIVSSASLACTGYPEIPADKRLTVLLSMAFYITGGLGLFVLASARLAELILV